MNAENTLTVEDIKSRLLQSDKVLFKIDIQKSDLSYTDPIYAEGFADSIREMKKKYKIWGWCDLSLTALFADLEAVDYLGGCSYKSEKDFKESSGYYEDMKETCLADLSKQIHNIAIPLGLTSFTA